MFWEFPASILENLIGDLPIKLAVATHDGCNEEAVGPQNFLSTLLCGYNGDKSSQKSFYKGMHCSMVPIKTVSRGAGT